MKQFEIEKDVPMPNGFTVKQLWPFKHMAVGDSFFIDELDQIPITRVRSSASVFGKRNQQRFTVRAVTGGIRVWRIA